ncbi:MAG: 1-(5-phosphoribosyl)-5-[(5-phosphoribosylamino)methylideneamino]imidazole-4-carboxamide isomerase [Chitinophagales bacterium]|nr:1-(5-phosphoribosyl)-5-[(5-phosphoribosylamino)methylideneamino]imidazole-4-carboxamide isomerase [Chitinophagales bacterium]
MTIIPAIDIIEGNCVRLEQGDYSKISLYNKYPFEVAQQFEDAGLKRLHLVDLDGAKAGSVRNWKVLETLARKTSLIIDFGGGIKNEKDVQIVFDSGAAMATIGSIATENETEFLNWVKKYGPEKFFLGADTKNEKIAIHGWQKITGIDLYDFIQKYSVQKINDIFCTDVSKDGKLQGPAIDLYKKIMRKFPELNLVASGGISSVPNLEDLQKAGCSGAIIGKAIYENKISLKELELFQSNT